MALDSSAATADIGGDNTTSSFNMSPISFNSNQNPPGQEVSAVSADSDSDNVSNHLFHMKRKGLFPTPLNVTVNTFNAKRRRLRSTPSVFTSRTQPHGRPLDGLGSL